MKKRSIYLAAIVLALLTLTACVKYEFSGAVDPAGKMFTITAAKAKKGDFLMSGSLEVEDGEQVVFTPSLKKGTIEIELIREPEDQSIDVLPNYDDAESYKYEFSSADSASDLVPAGSYMVKATCVNRATGTLQIDVKPAD